jgi:hypothetical protein
VKEVNHRLVGLPQFVGFLDKAEYLPDDILDVMAKAENFIENYSGSPAAALDNADIPDRARILTMVVRNYDFHQRAIADIVASPDYEDIIDLLGRYDRSPKGFTSERFEGTPTLEIKAHVGGNPFRFWVKPGTPRGMIYRIVDRHPKDYQEIKKWLRSVIKD